MLPSLPANAEHPWPSGHIFHSPGAHLTYRIVGPCCRLYDRDQLPWPCCRLQWRGKEPSWRRIGRRFIVDLSTRRHPSYCVEIVGQGYRGEAFVTTLYTVTLSSDLQSWWHTKRRPTEKLSIPEAAEMAELAYAASVSGGATVAATPVAAADTDLASHTDQPPKTAAEKTPAEKTPAESPTHPQLSLLELWGIG